MTTYKHFSGGVELKGQIHGLDNQSFNRFFPGVKGRRSDSFQMFVGYDADNVMLPVERTIAYKSNPSLHQCDGRCVNAKGRNCECACGGKNHGAGSFICEAA